MRASAQLAGRRALVTGGSAGVGAAVARALSAAGAEVVIAARGQAALTTLADEIGAHPVVADVGDVAACERLVATAADLLGGLDLLVNNAGAHHRGDFATQSAAALAAIPNPAIGLRGDIEKPREMSRIEVAKSQNPDHPRGLIGWFHKPYCPSSWDPLTRP